MDPFKIKLYHLLATPGGLTFRVSCGDHDAILRSVAFEIHVLLGLGDEPGNQVIEELEALNAAGRLTVEHDSAADETWLALQPGPNDASIVDQAMNDLDLMGALMDRIVASAAGPEPTVTAPEGERITVLQMGAAAEKIVLTALTPAGAKLLHQLATIATSVRA